jgi:hypothetical protein
MTKITLEFQNFIEFYEFIRKTSEFVDAVSGRENLQDLFNQLKGDLMATKQEVLDKIAAAKQAITDALTTETQQVKDAVQALKDKITAGTITAADLDEISTAIDGIAPAATAPIDAFSDQVV